MFINSKGEFCSFSELPTKRIYKIALFQKRDPYSSREKIAETYSKGIAYRIYKDLLNIYSDESLVIY